MGMRVDQAGVDQAVRRIDCRGGVGGGAARCPDLTDRVALDENVGVIGGAGGDVEYPPAAYDRVGHGFASARRLGKPYATMRPKTRRGSMGKPRAAR